MPQEPPTDGRTPAPRGGDGGRKPNRRPEPQAPQPRTPKPQAPEPRAPRENAPRSDRAPEPLAPTPPEQLGNGPLAFFDRLVGHLREVSRDTGDTVRFILVLGALGAVFSFVIPAAGRMLHSVPLAVAGGLGTAVLAGWGVVRGARANRQRAAAAEDRPPHRATGPRGRGGAETGLRAVPVPAPAPAPAPGRVTARGAAPPW
ncbi:hypothetical protein ACFQ2M_37335 [Kitasatospora saccharophila]|uniref:hypothetical protein n=1 Tax=Kitasatospora saccharophila TaxID=407973 RepID=UPI00362FFB19